MTQAPEDFVAQAQASARSVVEDPASWHAMRDGVRQLFDQMAAQWDEIATRPNDLTPLEAALERVAEARNAVDLGTGSGRGADLVASRYPTARVIGADLSQEMLKAAAARRRTRDVQFVAADASALPWSDSSLDLVVALNMFLFTEEMTRVLRPGGSLVIVYSGAERTPVYVPLDIVRAHLDGFDTTDGLTAEGMWMVASRR